MGLILGSMAITLETVLSIFDLSLICVNAEGEVPAIDGT